MVKKKKEINYKQYYKIYYYHNDDKIDYNIIDKLMDEFKMDVYIKKYGESSIEHNITDFPMIVISDEVSRTIYRTKDLNDITKLIKEIREAIK